MNKLIIDFHTHIYPTTLARRAMAVAGREHDDLEKLHHDADYCHRYLGVLLLTENRIKRTVLTDHIIDCRHCSNKVDFVQGMPAQQYRAVHHRR